jgi:hypothetical protein
MLERDGDEVARVTSLVRYAPDSHFSAHTHAGGEEFLVLEGAFSDDYGDFPTGTYVCNSVGSKHTPLHIWRLILVKLWWMHPDDRAFVRRDTTRDDQWRRTETPGVEVMDPPSLRRGACGALPAGGGHRAIAARPAGRRGVLVLDGACWNIEGSYHRGDRVRSPVGAAPALHSDRGCRLYVKRGHLLNPPPGPPGH